MELDVTKGHRRGNARLPSTVIEVRRVRVCVAVPAHVWGQVRAHAAVAGVSRSQVVTAALLASGIGGPHVEATIERVSRVEPTEG